MILRMVHKGVLVCTQIHTDYPLFLQHLHIDRHTHYHLFLFYLWPGNGSSAMSG